MMGNFYSYIIDETNLSYWLDQRKGEADPRLFFGVSSGWKNWRIEWRKISRVFKIVESAMNENDW